MEKWLQGIRSKALMALIETLGPNTAKDLVSDLAIAGIRVALGKSIKYLHWQHLPKGFVTGSASNEKLSVLHDAWARHVEDLFPSSRLVDTLGLKPLAEESEEEPEIFDCSEVVDDDAGTASTSRTSKDGLTTKFKKGDRVALLKRQSWACPTDANKAHRKDVLTTQELVVIETLANGTYVCETTVTDSDVSKQSTMWSIRRTSSSSRPST